MQQAQGLRHAQRRAPVPCPYYRPAARPDATRMVEPALGSSVTVEGPSPP